MRVGTSHGGRHAMGWSVELTRLKQLQNSDLACTFCLDGADSSSELYVHATMTVTRPGETVNTGQSVHQKCA